jgi:hypothetical protein
MRFIVKATPESEAGVLPTTEMLTEMGRFNEELVKAGVMLAADGCSRARKARGSATRRKADRHRRAVHRGEEAGRRLLADAGEGRGRGRRVAQARAVRGRRGGDSPGLRVR